MPGWRPERVLGSPRRMRETVLVMPGSSKNRGGGAEEVVAGAWLARDDLRRFRFLAAMELNLSRRRTLVNVSWERVLCPSSM